MGAYFWTTNIETPVTVDGAQGSQTNLALQYGLGFRGADLDGLWGRTTIEGLQVFLGVTADGVFGRQSTVALQTLLGVTADGVWGPQTTTALQNGLNLGSLGGAGKSVPPTAPPVTGTGGGRAAISESSVQYVRGQSYTSQTQVVQAACAAAGLTYSEAWLNGYITIGDRESSWDPNAINDYDSNANGAIVADGYPLNCSRGLFQCIPSTFADNHAVGTSDNIYDAVANGAASMLYVVAVYGVARDGSNLAANVQQSNPNEPPKGY